MPKHKPSAKPAGRIGSAKKVFDVMRPGKSLASTNSRSVLTSHQPQVPDPFLAQPSQLQESRQALLDSSQKVVVQPRADEAAEDVPITEHVPQTQAPAAQSAPNAPTTLSETADLSASDLANLAMHGQVELAPDIPTPAPEKEAPATETAESAESTDPSKPMPTPQIVVSQHKTGAGWSVIAMRIIIIVVLAGVVLDILLDTGMLSLNIPHSHFFGQM